MWECSKVSVIKRRSHNGCRASNNIECAPRYKIRRKSLICGGFLLIYQRKSRFHNFVTTFFVTFCLFQSSLLYRTIMQRRRAYAVELAETVFCLDRRCWRRHNQAGETTMKRHESGTMLSYCIVALLAAIIVPVSCSVIGLLHPSVADSWRNASGDADGCNESYGAFCICDASGHTYEVRAACHLQDDSCADLYLLQDTPGCAWLMMTDSQPNSLTIEDVRWFVCEEGLSSRTWRRRITVRAVYIQSGTFQTLGTNTASARLIWAES